MVRGCRGSGASVWCGVVDDVRGGLYAGLGSMYYAVQGGCGVLGIYRSLTYQLNSGRYGEVYTIANWYLSSLHGHGIRDAKEGATELQNLTLHLWSPIRVVAVSRLLKRTPRSGI